MNYSEETVYVEIQIITKVLCKQSENFDTPISNFMMRSYSEMNFSVIFLQSLAYRRLLSGHLLPVMVHSSGSGIFSVHPLYLIHLIYTAYKDNRYKQFASYK